MREGGQVSFSGALLAAALLAVVGGAACEVTQSYEVPTASGDPDDWANHVQPYVAPRCATLDCHGDPGRPLRLYSAWGLRVGDDRTAPLSALEIDANVESAVAVSPFAEPVSHALLLEPLDPAAGGWHHVGGVIWQGPGDPGYRCLAAWLSGEDPTASCAEAAAAVPRGAP